MLFVLFVEKSKKKIDIITNFFSLNFLLFFTYLRKIFIIASIFYYFDD